MTAEWGYPGVQLEQVELDPLRTRILELLQDEVRGLVGLAQDLGVPEAELLRTLDGMPEVLVVHQGPAGDEWVGCPLVGLRAGVRP